MSIGESSPFNSIIQPAIYDSPVNNSLALGGQFSGGTVTWTVLTDGGNILPNKGALLFVAVTNAQWSGPSAVSSPFLNITTQNKELLIFIADIDNSPIQVIGNWAGNTLTHLLIKASANYPGSPVFNSWIVVLDTPNFS